MTLLGKHSLRLRRTADAIPIMGFFVKTRRMLHAFEHFERDQLQRVLGHLSHLTQQQLLQSQELQRLAGLLPVSWTPA